MATSIVKPLLPSSAVRFTGESTLSIPPTFNQVVAVVGRHNWGPVGMPEDGEPIMSFAAFEAQYGSADSELRDAVIGAFLGMALTGQRGAGGVIPYRAAGAAVDEASLVVNNTTPAAALTLTAKQPGTLGNDLSVVIEDDSVDAARDVLRILYRGAEVEKFVYAQADIAALAAAINARPSRWVTADDTITGVALTHTAGTSLAGGNDGGALTAVEYEAATRALEFSDFGIFSPAALTDVAVKVQLASWVKTMAEEMRPVRMIVGGPQDETVDDAIAELVANPALRGPHVIRFAVGTYFDDYLEKNVGTAELAPRLAGVLAARGQLSALTRALLGGLHVVGGTGATTDELVAGRDAGLTMLRRVSNPAADLAVSQGVTTFIDRTADGLPFELFSEPRIVGLLDNTIRRMVQWGDDIVIGDLPVTDDTRNLVRKEVRKILDEYESTGLAKPGTGFVTVEPPDDPSLEDAIPYEFGFVPTRTANFLIGNGRVR